MLIANLILLISCIECLLKQQSRRRYAANGFAFVLKWSGYLSFRRLAAISAVDGLVISASTL